MRVSPLLPASGPLVRAHVVTGKTWTYTRILEAGDGSVLNGGVATAVDDEFSYPSLVEDAITDGVIHVAYTWLRETVKYSRITEVASPTFVCPCFLCYRPVFRFYFFPSIRLSFFPTHGCTDGLRTGSCAAPALQPSAPRPFLS